MKEEKKKILQKINDQIRNKNIYLTAVLNKQKI